MSLIVETEPKESDWIAREQEKMMRQRLGDFLYGYLVALDNGDYRWWEQEADVD